MATTESAPAPGLPDYVLNQDAVLGDSEAAWRYGRAPDYSKTRAFFQETKTTSHEAQSLPDLVQNLVKNWEIEASFKTSISDWRTIDQSTYGFSLNGGPPQNAEHMLRVGTYNALIPANKYYDPANLDFSTSHKAFKRMMPSFAWEVLEVYSGPPTVAFKWRHWGKMANDYVGRNEAGEKVTIKAHGGVIEMQGMVTAKVNDKLQLQHIDVWYDPMDMFRSIARNEAAVITPYTAADEQEGHEHEHEGEAPVAASGCPIAH
ncbi:hypothetical protein FQN57_006868 [Myotisia sp. PD_48]|nr:hypothetical protein FQN57_006868 [Myotisia sp. PD_48]